MATYKKKGFKKVKKTGFDKVKEESLVAKGLESADDIAIKSERFLEKYQNIIFAAIGIIALAVVGYYYYHNNVVIPKRMEAANEMYVAQNLFEKAVDETDPSIKKDLFRKALEGADGKYGFLDIIDEYGNTPSGKLAHYYAGVSYYHLGEFDKAISELSKFKSGDEILQPLAYGVIGDAFLQLDQPEDALEYYEKAIGFSSNDFTTPMFLMKAGKTALALYETRQDNKYLKKAEKYFKRIVEEYPKSHYSGDAKIYLAAVQYGQ
jgi:tetratricopeptide (TPR) repeat protein